MIRALKILSAALFLWLLYWGATGWGLRAGVTGWFEEQRRQGWQAEYSGISSGGFPARHAIRLSHPVLADPGTGAAWRGGWLNLESPALWPGRLSLVFPDSAQRLSVFDQTVELQAEAMAAELDLAPGLALTLEKGALASGPWEIRKEGETRLTASALELSMVLVEGSLYRVDLNARDFAPRLTLPRLSQPDALPAGFEVLTARADITFDHAWDRSALELRRPQPREILLHLAEAQWGPMKIKMTGALRMDERGQPEGTLALQVKNWRDILVMAEASGALPPQLSRGTEKILSVIAGLSGNSNHLDTQLRFGGGSVWLGPIPAGPAPRIALP